MTEFDELINDDDFIINDEEEVQEDDGIILPLIEQELIDKLREVFPSSVQYCEDKDDLFFMKGTNSVIDFIEEQLDKQKNRGV